MLDLQNRHYEIVVGKVQSGKTRILLEYCQKSIHELNISCIYFTRNIKADKLQLLKRAKEFDTFLKIVDGNQYHDEQLAKIIQSGSCIVLFLMNNIQSKKAWNVVHNYNTQYNLCIDEVDLSVKSKERTTKLEETFYKIKERANHVLGVTATPVANYLNEDICKIHKTIAPDDYRGVEHLVPHFVENVEQAYDQFVQKDAGILLHKGSVKKRDQMGWLRILPLLYPNMVVMTYNADGIFIRGAERLMKNSRKYFMTNYCGLENVHVFKSATISSIIQLLTDRGYKHISIISGLLASRGVSFVSDDYLKHITDQYYDPSKQAHGETLVQGLRILGRYQDNKQLDIYCTEKSWERITDQCDYIENITEQMVDKTNRIDSLDERPLSLPTRRRVL